MEWDSQVPGTSADLYFLRARYYDPATGRFIGRDPIEFAQRYAYAGNNPVAYTDPSGLIGLPFVDLDDLGCFLSEATSLLEKKACGEEVEAELSPVSNAIETVGEVAEYCYSDFYNYVPGFGECWLRLDLVVIGSGLVVAGTGGAFVGCIGSVAVLGPPTFFVATVPGCALSATAGAATAAAGGLLIVEGGFGSWGNADE